MKQSIKKTITSISNPIDTSNLLTTKFNSMKVSHSSSLYCFTSVARALGFDADNKIYTQQDLIDFCTTNNVALILTDDVHQCILNEGAPSVLIGFINRQQDHIVTLAYYAGQSVDDLLDITNIALAVKKKPKPKQELALLKDMSKRIKAKKQKKVKIEIIPRPKRVTKEVFKVGFDKQRAYNANNLKEATAFASGYLQEARPLLKQMILPDASVQLYHYPDDLSDKTYLHKAFYNLSVAGIPFGNNKYLGVIHSGQYNAQYFQISTTFSNYTSFLIANLTRSSSNTNQNLVDTFIQSKCEFNTIKTQIQQQQSSNPQTIIPLHTALSNDPASETTVMYAPSEVYDVNGNAIVNSNSILSSFGSQNVAMPFGTSSPNSSSDKITLAVEVVQNNTGSTLTLTFGVAFGYGTNTGTFIGSATNVPAGQTTIYVIIDAATVASSGGLGGCDRLYSVFYNFNNTTASVTCTIERVLAKVLKMPFVEDAATAAAYMPFSKWVASPIPSFLPLTGLVESERTISSSILYTDFSNQLNVSGTTSTGIVNSHAPPAESGIWGLSSLGGFQNAKVMSEVKGVYAVPLRLIDIGSMSFSNIDDTWYGRQPYSVIMTKVGDTTLNSLQARYQIVDIIEFKCENTQLLKVDDSPENPAIHEAIKNAFHDQVFILENPLHLSAIGNFLKNAFNFGRKTILPIATAAAMASGNSQAMRAADIAGSISNAFG